MAYLIVDLDGATHSRFDNAAALLDELDRIRSEDPSLIDDLAVLRYDREGRRTGAPVPAAGFARREARDVAQGVLVSSVAVAVPTEPPRLATAARGSGKVAVAQG